MRADPDTEPSSKQTVTLAFVRDALAAFADPAAVVSDARRWSRHVGIVGADPAAVSTFVERHGLQQDFELGSLEPYAVLSKLKWEADTDRYVLVGASQNDQALADYVNWEYVELRKAAEKADWTLAEEAGLFARIRARLSRVSSRP